MFIAITLILLFWFYISTYSAKPAMPQDQLWFMMSVFVGVSYVAGFLDSRLFAKLDKKYKNSLEEAEKNYDQKFPAEENPTSV